MKPLANETFIFDDRQIRLSWYSDPPDPSIRVSQVSAYCIYNNQLVLVRNKRGWEIPGGHSEPGETVEKSLERELSEEAGIKPGFQSQIIGWMKVDDPGNPGIEGKISAQLRYYVVISELEEFVPDEEIFERTLIDINDFSKYVSWGDSPTGKAQIDTLKKYIR